MNIPEHAFVPTIRCPKRSVNVARSFENRPSFTPNEGQLVGRLNGGEFAIVWGKNLACLVREWR